MEAKDKTLEILENLAINDSKLKVISFSRNFGHQAAVTAGLKRNKRRCCCNNRCWFTRPTRANSRNA